MISHFFLSRVLVPGCRCAVGRQLGLSQDDIRMCAGGEGGDNCGVWNRAGKAQRGTGVHGCRTRSSSSQL